MKGTGGDAMKGRGGDAGREEVQRGLWAKTLMTRERAAITRTIGEIMERKMRGAEVDAADLYQKVGGTSEFTHRLFAETFGSKSAGVKKGRISSDPATYTPIDEINEALTAVAARLAEAKVSNALGQPTDVRRVNPREIRSIFQGDYICVNFGVAASGRVPWPDDPFVAGPTTWVFGAATEAVRSGGRGARG